MNENELAWARMYSAGLRYATSAGAWVLAEMDGREVVGASQTDARDAWYTARDLLPPCGRPE